MYKAAEYVEDFPEGVPFGDRLREVLEEEGSNISDLARRLDVNRFHVSKLLRHSRVQIPTLAYLAVTFERLPLVLLHNGDQKDIVISGSTCESITTQLRRSMKEEQAKNRYTARELAKKAGVSKVTVERIRAGNTPYTDTIDTIFGAFGFTPVYLL